MIQEGGGAQVIKTMKESKRYKQEKYKNWTVNTISQITSYDISAILYVPELATALYLEI